ncbi:MAG TPA: hypothetical protein VFM98_08010 [Ramlibacter sp.]|uniref:hypothetical protein n=1 Tax=Ramlibacter sp. TaxID=1917967 RepID=UPI002D810675|nr:hypothetical protein [Ramlibacter sp.]HET8745534.1 hypothetical protein [Ramlibacter sp.]
MFPKVNGRALGLAACVWSIACGGSAFAAAESQAQAAAPAARPVASQAAPDAATPEPRLQALEGELRALRELAQQNAAAVAGLRAEIDRSRGERSIAGALVVLLSVLLLGLAAWVGWRWYGEQRLKRVGRWFEEHGASRSGARPAGQGLHTQPAAILREGPPAPVRGEAPGAPTPLPDDGALTPVSGQGALTATPDQGTPAPAVDDVGLAPIFVEDTPTPPSPRGGEFGGFGGSLAGGAGVHEPVDVHERVAFYHSLGDYAQARALLEAHEQGLADPPGPTGTERERMMIPPASARLGVDIDLGELAGESESAALSELPVLDVDLDEPTTAPEFDASGRDSRGF